MQLVEVRYIYVQSTSSLLFFVNSMLVKRNTILKLKQTKLLQNKPDLLPFFPLQRNKQKSTDKLTKQNKTTKTQKIIINIS